MVVNVGVGEHCDGVLKQSGSEDRAGYCGASTEDSKRRQLVYT